MTFRPLAVDIRWRLALTDDRSQLRRERIGNDARQSGFPSVQADLYPHPPIRTALHRLPAPRRFVLHQIHRYRLFYCGIDPAYRVCIQNKGTAMRKM